MEAFAGYLRGIVDADSSSLTIKLAGTFTPTEELHTLAARASALAVEVHGRAVAAGVLRPDVTVADIALLFEQLASIKLGGEERASQLRHRYLTLMMDSMRVPRPTASCPARAAGRGARRPLGAARLVLAGLPVEQVRHQEAEQPGHPGRHGHRRAERRHRAGDQAGLRRPGRRPG
ncbi:hypothetical protein ACFQ0B_36730 [Nonomuraea thailandensis]